MEEYPLKQRILLYVILYMIFAVMGYELSVRLNTTFNSILVGVLAIQTGIAYLIAIPILPIAILHFIIAIGLLFNSKEGGF